MLELSITDFRHTPKIPLALRPLRFAFQFFHLGLRGRNGVRQILLRRPLRAQPVSLLLEVGQLHADFGEL